MRARFQYYRVDVPFDMVDRDQRQAPRQAQGFCIRQPHQQRPDQPWPHRRRHRRQVLQPRSGTLQGLPHHRDDRPQVFARRQFRNHPPVLSVGVHLGGHHTGKHEFAVFHHGGGGFIARRFDRQDAHYLVLSHSSRRSSGVAAGRTPLRAPKLRSAEAFQAHRWAAPCKSRSRGRAGCPGSRAEIEPETLLRMTVSSSLKSWAAAAATAEARSARVSRSTPEAYTWYYLVPDTQTAKVCQFTTLSFLKPCDRNP